MNMAVSGQSQTPADADPLAPREIGRKFGTDGRVRPFAGNTIIAHLPQQGADFDAFDRLLDIYRSLPSLRFASKVTVLPTSSYHMTLFAGATDEGRDGGPWPAGLPRQVPIEACNQAVWTRLADFHCGVTPPFRMIVDDSAPLDSINPITIPLRPADDAEADKLRRLRDRLADVLQMRAPDHDNYQFHITMAYLVAPFTPADQQEYRKALKSWIKGLRTANVIFALGAPEYCVFRDMFAFQRLMILSP